MNYTGKTIFRNGLLSVKLFVYKLISFDDDSNLRIISLQYKIFIKEPAGWRSGRLV